MKTADCPATGARHTYTSRIDATRQKGTELAFCAGCGAANPRCATCGRNVTARPNGSTRCAKGHTHTPPPKQAGGVREIRALAGERRVRPARGSR